MTNKYLLRRTPRVGTYRPTAIDLFSGAGGITLGLVNAGFDVLLGSDINGACGLTHQKNFPRIPFWQTDVSRLSGETICRELKIKKGELDLLVGGPPCQGFSIIGQREIDDPRNKLFSEYLRIASELQPRCVVMENVPGLATLSRGALLKGIGRAFSNAGYVVECAELLAAQYGVPQMRWRMFFIGWRRDLLVRGGFPVPTHGDLPIGALVPNRTIRPHEMRGFVPLRDAIGDLPPIAAGESATKYTRAARTEYQEAMRHDAPALLRNHYAAKLSAQNLERIRFLKPGQDWRALPLAMLPNGMKRALRKDHTRRYRRMVWTGVARSIITRFRDPKSGEYTHPEQDRTISIREAARIQTFPDWFAFEGSISEQYDQVGNAVPPLLARAVALELRKLLTNGAAASKPVVTRYRMPAEYGYASSLPD